MSESIIPCVVIQTTPQAVRIVVDNLASKWVPRSVVRDGENVKILDKNLWIADWWAEKEQL